jgi:MEDS: MEthanogen/methylotroph, DcmR Sensory domain
LLIKPILARKACSRPVDTDEKVTSGPVMACLGPATFGAVDDNSATTRDTTVGSWPTGHSGWLFGGLGEFEGRAASFLAQGLLRHEQLMFIVDDPQPKHWPIRLRDSGVLQIASISDIYGSHRIVDANKQRATFTTVLEEARSQGFSGLRVVADNTSLIATPEHLLAWSGWEAEADRFMADNPVTVMCGFDRTRAEPEYLTKIVALHATLVSTS